MPVALRKGVFYTFLILFIIEGLLEYRGYTRGFSTLIFGVPPKSYETGEQKNIKNIYGPSVEFPFRSEIIEPELKSSAVVRLWLASASYAEATDRPVQETFPSVVCDELKNKGVPCQMLNASKAGWQIPNNIEQILDKGLKWQPRYILLYQMGNDAKSLLQENQKRLDQSTHLNNGIFDIVANKLQHLLEQTNLYVHTREYIGGYVLMSSQLNKEIPEFVFEGFRDRLEAFIQACKKVQATPVFMTFMGRNRVETADKIPLQLKFQLLKYTGLVAPETWPLIIAKLNDIIRQVAYKNNIYIIDLDSAFLKNSVYFKDFFHLTKKGHKETGIFVAKEMEKVINGI